LHLAISPASQTFALGKACCFANIHTWQSSNGPLAQSLCEPGRASRRMAPIHLQKSSNSVIAVCDLFTACQQYTWRCRVQQRTIKVAANNSSHCTLAAHPFPLQQHQAPECACITFSQISNHIYDQLIKMLYFFPLVSCTAILTCSFYKVITTCSVIFTFFLQQQQQQKRYFSASKS